MPILPLSRRSSESRPSGRWRLSRSEQQDTDHKNSSRTAKKVKDEQNRISYYESESEEERSTERHMKHDTSNKDKKKKKSHKKKSHRQSPPLIRLPVLSPNASSYYSL